LAAAITQSKQRFTTVNYNHKFFIKLTLAEPMSQGMLEAYFTKATKSLMYHKVKAGTYDIMR
jgi:hypothetical protein